MNKNNKYYQALLDLDREEPKNRIGSRKLLEQCINRPTLAKYNRVKYRAKYWEKRYRTRPRTITIYRNPPIEFVGDTKQKELVLKICDTIMKYQDMDFEAKVLAKIIKEKYL